jgi:endonuclease-3
VRRTDKAQRIREILDELYPQPPIPLDHVDPFTLLVAVVLSAQTTDKKVNEVTPVLFARAPTPEAMAKLTEPQIRSIIRTVGLAPQKAKALRGLSRRLCEVYGGRVPQTFDDLESLPGVGHKTASVVLAQAFGVPTFPVDTHIHRLAARWGLSDGTSVGKTERDLKRVFPEESWNRLHIQIIYFGREHCPALRHDMSTCPICGWAASKRRIADELRRRAVRKGA